ANRLIGISLEKTNEKIHNSTLKSLAEGWGVEPTVRIHRWGFCRPLANLSITLPLNGHGSRIRTGVSQFRAGRPRPLDDAAIYGAGGEVVSETFAPHLRFNSFLKSLAEGVGFEPTTPLVEVPHEAMTLGVPVLQTGDLGRSPSPPLSGDESARKRAIVAIVEGEPCIRAHDSPSIPKRTLRSPFVSYPIAYSFTLGAKGSCYFG